MDRSELLISIYSMEYFADNLRQLYTIMPDSYILSWAFLLLINNPRIPEIKSLILFWRNNV